MCELARLREGERLRLQREAEAAKKWQARVRTADEEEYGRVVLIANTNRDEGSLSPAGSSFTEGPNHYFRTTNEALSQ